jgi:hypothetical protein
MGVMTVPDVWSGQDRMLTVETWGTCPTTSSATSWMTGC